MQSRDKLPISPNFPNNNVFEKQQLLKYTNNPNKNENPSTSFLFHDQQTRLKFFNSPENLLDFSPNFCQNPNFLSFFIYFPKLNFI